MLKILLGWLQNGLGTDLGMDVHTNGHASPSLQCGELEWNFLDRFCYIYPSTRALGDISLVLENQQFTTNPNSQHVQIRKDRRIAGLATKQRITHKHFSYPFSSLCACSPSWPASLPSRRCSLLLWPTAPTPLPMWQLLLTRLPTPRHTPLQWPPPTPPTRTPMRPPTPPTPMPPTTVKTGWLDRDLNLTAELDLNINIYTSIATRIHTLLLTTCNIQSSYIPGVSSTDSTFPHLCRLLKVKSWEQDIPLQEREYFCWNKYCILRKTYTTCS